MELRLEELTDDDFPIVREWIDPVVFRIFSSPVDDSQLKRLLSAYQDDMQTDIGMKAVDSATGNTVGIVHAVVDRAGRYIHLQQIVVDPVMRHQGLGTHMVSRFVDVCFRDHGANRVQLFTDVDNHPAISCYEKAGFRREDPRYLGEYVFHIVRDDWDKSPGV